MLEVIRYVNGVKVEQEDLKNIVIDSDLIREIIRDVNERIKRYQKECLEDIKTVKT